MDDATRAYLEAKVESEIEDGIKAALQGWTLGEGWAVDPVRQNARLGWVLVFERDGHPLDNHPDDKESVKRRTVTDSAAEDVVPEDGLTALGTAVKERVRALIERYVEGGNHH